MNAMQKIRHHLTVLGVQYDEWGARHLAGWSKVKFRVAQVSRPVWWRLKTIVRSAELLYKYGPVTRDKSGVGLIDQALEQYCASIEHRIPPDKYYLYALYNDFSHVDQYIPTRVWGRLLESLLAVQDTEDGKLLDDKRASCHHFDEHGIPILPTLAEFEDGAITPREWGPGTSLPHCDLFSKPVGRRQGMGARRWFFMGLERGYRTEEGDYVDQDGLLEYLKDQSRQEVVLLQKRAENHPKIQALTGPTLAAMRIFTMRSPGGTHEYITGLIGLPLKDIVANNFIPEFEVIGAPIDEKTGRLGPAYRKKLDQVMEPIKVHPTTGERIDGFQLPFWRETVELALQAHETLPTIALVGWDIALTAEGPVIIEGNKTPGGDSPQVAHKMPWGATRFPKLYVENLEMATENN